MRRHLRYAILWCTLLAFSLAQTGARAQAHAEGLAAGQAANTTSRAQLTPQRASAVVPGYTASPAESTWFGRTDLPTQAQARLLACALTPGDPICQAQTGALASASTPRTHVSPYDPAVLTARRIAGNPSTVLEDLASYYAGCQADTSASPVTERRVCRQYQSNATLSCVSDLQVTVERSTSCGPGEWFATGTSGTTGVAVQCIPDRSDTQQHFRVTDAGAALAFFDVDMTTPLVFPRMVAVVPDAPIGADDGPLAAWVVDNLCSGDACHLTALLAQEYRRTCIGSGGPEGDGRACTSAAPFIAAYAACPAGTQSGDRIIERTGTRDDGYVETALDALTCFAPSPSPTPYTGLDSTATIAGYGFWTPTVQRAVAGWQVNPAYGPVPRMTLAYERPRSSVGTSERWRDLCPATDAGQRCTAADTPRCVDGPATREIDGVAVTRACWRMETKLSCAVGSDECAPLRTTGCTQSGTVCRQWNAADGRCDVTENTFSCPTAPGSNQRFSNCPANVFCLGASCFNTASARDGDFARSMAFLEAAREAGTYLDTDRLQLFRGEANRCRDRLFKNCCYADAGGTGMNNQSVLGAGSRLVFDVLMNAGNRDFLVQGISALLTSGGFSGSFTSYGVTVAVNGTALPAGSSVLLAGENIAIAFDPWSLAISVVMYAVMSMLSCDADEARLAMKEGARLCHTVGDYCSSCIRILGSCVSCIEHTTGKCCFNSVLARIVNEQGRSQLGRAWGDARSPDCSGFAVAELQRLDFAAMDLSEFYASIVPTLPDMGRIQQRNSERAAECYYGRGKCP